MVPVKQMKVTSATVSIKNELYVEAMDQNKWIKGNILVYFIVIITFKAFSS